MPKTPLVSICCAVLSLIAIHSRAFACPVNYLPLKEFPSGGHLCGCQSTSRACFDGPGASPEHLQLCNDAPACSASPPVTPHNGDGDRLTPRPTVAPSATAVHHEEPTPVAKATARVEPRPTPVADISPTRHAEETPHAVEPHPTKVPGSEPTAGSGDGGSAPEACLVGWSDMFNDAVVNLSDDASDPSGLLEVQLLQKAGAKVSWAKYVPAIEASGADTELTTGIASLATDPQNTDSIDSCFSMLAFGKQLVSKCKQGNASADDKKVAKALSDQLIKLPRKFLDLELIGEHEVNLAKKVSKNLLHSCRR